MKRKIVTILIALLAVALSSCIAGYVRQWLPSADAEVDSLALAMLEYEGTRDIREGVQAVYDIRESRVSFSLYLEESRVAESLAIEASIAESRAEEAQIAASIAEEERVRASVEASIEASAEESRIEASIEESIRASMEDESGTAETGTSETGESGTSETEESSTSSTEESGSSETEESGTSETEESSSSATEESGSAETEEPSTSETEESETSETEESGSSETDPAETETPIPDGPVVFVGDSRTANFRDMRFMPASHCYTLPGSCFAWYENADLAAAMHPSKAVFFAGMNELGTYKGDPEPFREDYERLLEYFAEKSPGTVIYLNKIIPANAKAIAAYPGRAFVDTYNRVIEEICEAHGWHWVETSEGFDEKYYLEDGVHFKGAWYATWWKNLRKEVGF